MSAYTNTVDNGPWNDTRNIVDAAAGIPWSWRQ